MDFYVDLPKAGYIELPEDIGVINVRLNGLPKTHLGKNIEALTTVEICQLYVDYLRNMVNSTKKHLKIKGTIKS
jgi:hypothetical protein